MNLFLCFMFLSTNVLLFLSQISAAADTISKYESLTDGKTLVSSEGSFELGFFSPGDSGNRYLGIWYKNIPVKTVVWVANRERPINGSSGALKINGTGGLVLLNQSDGGVVWSSRSSKEARNPIAKLLDSGNFVLKDEKDSDPESYLWQSFDYPSDTLLPGMKLGWDLKTGLNRRLVAWKTADDPSPGDLCFEIELDGYPESVMLKGSTKYFRGGPWNGLRYSGAPELRLNPVFSYKFVSNREEVFYTYELKNKSVISRVVLNQTDFPRRQRFVWIEAIKTWKLYGSVPRDYCDRYGLCGAYGICIINESPVCMCLKGFRPNSEEQWNLMDWSSGCVRNTPLNCGNEDGFAKFEGLKLPDTTHTWVNTSMNLKECKAKCLVSCSCMAYANSDIRGGGSGCAMWFGDLIDIRQLSDGGQVLYIRMAASDIGGENGPQRHIAVVIVAAVVLISVLLIASYFICKCRTNMKEQEEGLDLPSFSMATIIDATDNFSDKNKLGEGGFGPVYKGTLQDGQEIAVKRLSVDSGQGLNEFKNEVILISKLQHRNLVKLLGFCIVRAERMLIYEYMSNKSLDFFIFDETRGKLLDWYKRFNIICGIARGLLYLHQDSRLRIIHRDLKASNILLDNEMNPKISDFGLARSFGSDHTVGNTKKVVGTYGYMAPEYAVDGLFSIKSDVFSFGVLLLEVVTGKKNRGFYHPSHSHNLIGHAWRLWREGRPIELTNELYGDNSCLLSEVLRCIHVGLLCVQQHPEDRPNMSTVGLMLASESSMPQPKEPGFFIGRSPIGEGDASSSKNRSFSTNEISITTLEGR
ncbi:G-type lectin S-receptor-like serine/threonine-protein kinase At4g27290 [Malania oleifera]|uniref:G-type lectin S-receptor-like serine/threonine-protein kinase At4g27290 n=1 Tax=Malania oleifera TaxID=397392 RepID=UPI0025AE352B|nr:G-type lectin S-receptor-like serine/threonine-protein kinase At4g27290 [Malania oleifera]